MTHVIQMHPNEIALGPLRKLSALDVLTPFKVVRANSDEVDTYVANHPELATLLEGICARLRDSFGANSELSLEFYSDPEQQDQHLTLYVRQEKYAPGVLRQIETVTTPFMSDLEAASGNLLITTDFRRPRG